MFPDSAPKDIWTPPPACHLLLSSITINQYTELQTLYARGFCLITRDLDFTFTPLLHIILIPLLFLPYSSSASTSLVTLLHLDHHPIDLLLFSPYPIFTLPIPPPLRVFRESTLSFFFSRVISSILPFCTLETSKYSHQPPQNPAPLDLFFFPNLYFTHRLLTALQAPQAFFLDQSHLFSSLSSSYTHSQLWQGILNNPLTSTNNPPLHWMPNRHIQKKTT